MKSFLSKIFAITVVVLLMATVTMPAYAMSLPGQEEFWSWVNGQTGISPSTAPVQTPAPTPQPTPEPTPEPTPKPTDPPAEASAAATAPAAEETVPPEATATATVPETAAPVPEATQPAVTIVVDNSTTYNSWTYNVLEEATGGSGDATPSELSWMTILVLRCIGIGLCIVIPICVGRMFISRTEDHDDTFDDIDAEF